MMENNKEDLSKNIELISTLLTEIERKVDDQHIDDALDLINTVKILFRPLVQAKHQYKSVECNDPIEQTKNVKSNKSKPQLLTNQEKIFNSLQKIILGPDEKDYMKEVKGLTDSMLKHLLSQKVDIAIENKNKGFEKKNPKEYITDYGKIYNTLETIYPKLKKLEDTELQISADQIIYVCMIYNDNKAYLCIKYNIEENKANFLYYEILNYKKEEIEQVLNFLETKISFNE